MKQAVRHGKRRDRAPIVRRVRQRVRLRVHARVSRFDYSRVEICSSSGTLWSVEYNQSQTTSISQNETGTTSASENGNSVTGDKSGNSISGGYTFTQTATQGYSFNESGVSGTSTYTLSEDGTKTYTLSQSGSQVSGAYSLSDNGTDNYTVTESGYDKGVRNEWHCRLAGLSLRRGAGGAEPASSTRKRDTVPFEAQLTGESASARTPSGPAIRAAPAKTFDMIDGVRIHLSGAFADGLSRTFG